MNGLGAGLGQAREPEVPKARRFDRRPGLVDRRSSSHMFLHRGRRVSELDVACLIAADSEQGRGHDDEPTSKHLQAARGRGLSGVHSSRGQGLDPEPKFS